MHPMGANSQLILDFWRGEPSLACSNSWKLPDFRAARTFSYPATAIPAFLAIDSNSTTLRASSSSTSFESAAGILAFPPKARANLFRATARSKDFPSAQTHAPRPGSLFAMSGTTNPAGSTTNLTMDFRGAVAPVAMHLRSGSRFVKLFPSRFNRIRPEGAAIRPALPGNSKRCLRLDLLLSRLPPHRQFRRQCAPT